MGVIGLEKTLAMELTPGGVGQLHPPLAHEIPCIKVLVEQGGDRDEYDSYQEWLEDLSAGIPLERIGQPEKLGETSLSLLGTGELPQQCRAPDRRRV